MGTYASVNPAALDDVVITVDLATPGRFVEACRDAGAAQRAWSGVPAPVRGRVVAAIGRLVEENAETLARLVTREVGKPLVEARGEVQEVVDTCDFFLGEGRRLYGQTVPSEMPDKQLFTFRVPAPGSRPRPAGPVWPRRTRQRTWPRRRAEPRRRHRPAGTGWVR